MIAFALLSLPMFGIVALGWAATWLHLVPSDALNALGTFSFRFALPALVFQLIASQPIGRLFNPIFYGGYLASGGFLFALVFGLSCLLQKNAIAAAGAHATTTTVSSLGFLGLPLVLAFLGQRATGPLAMASLAEVMVLLSVGAVIVGTSHAGGTGIISLMVRGTVLNPVVAAIMLGTLFALIGMTLPAALSRFLGFLGGSAGPTALFGLGAQWLCSRSTARPRWPRSASPWRSSPSIRRLSGTC
jgi:predicted permease